MKKLTISTTEPLSPKQIVEKLLAAGFDLMRPIRSHPSYDRHTITYTQDE